MTVERQIAFWLAVLAALIAALWLLSPVLTPFVAGIVLAYLLNPLAQRLEHAGISRAVSGLVILVLVLAALVVLMLLLGPLLASQFMALIERIPGYVRRLQELIAESGHSWLEGILGDRLPDAGKSVAEWMAQGAGWVARFVGSLLAGGQALISILSLLVVTPIVAFYVLCDWNRMVDTIDGLVPRPQQETVRMLAREVDQVIAGFIRGQSGVCLILGSFYAVALALTGLQFGVLIGFITGILSFIPYVGSLTGLVLSATVAFAQFWPDWVWIATVLGIFFAGQVLEGYVLQPLLIGKHVGLHPVWLMFALFAFGYLFGFAGVLVAVPVAAAIGVLLRFALRQYRASALYGSGDAS